MKMKRIGIFLTVVFVIILILCRGLKAFWLIFMALYFSQFLQRSADDSGENDPLGGQFCQNK